MVKGKRAIHHWLAITVVRFEGSNFAAPPEARHTYCSCFFLVAPSRCSGSARRLKSRNLSAATTRSIASFTLYLQLCNLLFCSTNKPFSRTKKLGKF